MIGLDTAQSLRVDPGARVWISCASGVVWITQEGDIRDLFLANGEELFLSARGVALLTALEPALLRVEDQSARSPSGGALARALRTSGGKLGRRLADLFAPLPAAPKLVLRQ